MSASPTSPSLSERLAQRDAELSSCQDRGRLLARVRGAWPKHPVLLIRFLSLWISIVALALAIVLAVTPATLAEMDAMGWSAAGLLEARLNHLNRLAPLPLELPLLPSVMVLVSACGLTIRASMHALAITLGQSSGLLAWEASELQAIRNAMATLASQDLEPAKPMPPLDLEALDWAGSGEPFGSTPIEPERVGALQRSDSPTQGSAHEAEE